MIRDSYFLIVVYIIYIHVSVKNLFNSQKKKKVMKNIFNVKIFELQKISDNISSCTDALFEIEDKINYLEKLCINESNKHEHKDELISKKEKLKTKLKGLERNKNKLNEELNNNEDMTELIKIKYALLLSNYAAYHDNPTAKPKKEIKTLIQKIFNFNKTDKAAKSSEISL